MKDTAELLYQWRQLRLKLTEDFSEENLQSAISWFRSLNPSIHGFNYDDMKTWPDIWQYISEGYYTESGNSLALFYTTAFAGKKPELWLVHDLYHSDIYLVVVVDGYVLNRRSGNLERLEDIESDLDVHAKHTSDKVLDAVKYN